MSCRVRRVAPSGMEIGLIQDGESQNIAIYILYHTNTTTSRHLWTQILLAPTDAVDAWPLK